MSLGRLASLIARLVGWSPAGRTLLLTGAEGPYAHVFDGMTATVTSISENEMVVRPDPGGLHGLVDDAFVRLTARHAGWTVHSLMLTPIAVVAEADYPTGGRTIAIAIARIIGR